MKNVIIRNLYAVGMHHWGAKELSVGPLYYCHFEKDNPKDPNAVAIFSDKERHHRVAYFRREDAAFLCDFFKNDIIHGHCYLRAKFSVNKYTKKTGPMQNCSVGFLCPNDQVENVKSKLSKYEHRIW